MQNATQTILSNKRLHLHKKIRLKRKINLKKQTNKQTNKQNKQQQQQKRKASPSHFLHFLTQHIFLNDFSQVVYLFLSQKSQKSLKLVRTIYIMECYLLFVISLRKMSCFL